MAARNESKAVAAIAELERQGLGDGSVHFLECNLPDPHAVKRAAEAFLKQETRLDILGASPLPVSLQNCGY
jgi:NAD(P)-dependent dehydrogenase (short-subunit alcohol dehydrogenase family)